MSVLQQAAIQPVGVNPAGVESHARYAARFNFGFPLLSDGDRAIARAYGALKWNGLRIQRTVYVIRRDGTVAFAARGAPPPAELAAAVAP
jgi:peroxiredoxin Q/BCP